ncbi:MAG TPA: multiheme c-type cytochrome [Planctomycetaceae bacterium]|nr:multiheme c-type cytochrome [Planctomycetaceae bacterium]
MPPQPLPPPGQDASLLRTDLRYLGANSCAASNCHGGPANGRITGSESTIWSLVDPHANAFAVLYNEQSQRIARNLGLEAAHKAQVCLNCHALDAGTAHLDDENQHILADGVSCEMCHGPASQWLEPHRRAEWLDPSVWTTERKQALGFRDTKDVRARAQACAACHVGAPGRDVNHDLIAAGHPRLYFEFSAYHALLPAHWNRRDDLERHGPGLEARLWAVGQAVSAETAARLLARRASDARAPWPELAEYSCFACHHELETPSWRQAPGREFAGGRAGGLSPAQWHFAAVPSLALHPAVAAGADLDERRHALSSELARFPAVRREPIAAQANALADRLADWGVRLNNADYSAPAVQRLTKQLAASRSVAPGDWDAATQLYLAVVAVNQARVQSGDAPASPPRADDAAVYAELRQIRDLLAFPSGETSRADSPRGFRPEVAGELSGHLERIQQLIDAP